jgi:nucleoid-associated protein YgaU
MRPYADMIWKYAKVYGNDPTVMAALYWRESFAAAKAQGKDPATITLA